MTTQFRSRIKSAINYTNETGATGSCCLPDGSKISGDDVTLYSCNRLNGFFRPVDPDLLECPDRGLTGCCCACSYIREQEGGFVRFLYNDENSVFTENSDYYNASLITDDFNDLGLKDNVTQCECFNRQGNWFYGKCSDLTEISSLCGHYENLSDNDKQNHDVRFPAACCHGAENDPSSLECDEVCTLKECQDLALQEEENSTSSFDGTSVGGDGLLCSPGEPPRGVFVDNVNCDVDAVQNVERLQQTYGGEFSTVENEIKNLLKPENASKPGFRRKYQKLIDEKTRVLKSQKFPCLELTTVDNQLEHKCSQKTQEECFSSKGYIYPRLSDRINRCTDVTTYLAKRGAGGLRYTPATTSSSNMPEAIGQVFQGGIYAGIFEPGVSLIKKQENKKMGLYTSRRMGEGTSNKKWALIMSLTPFDPYTESAQKYKMNSISDSIVELPTSYYDGFYNTYGDGTNYYGYPSEIFEKIRSLVYNGFVGWYVPSIDELSFLYSKAHSGTRDGIEGMISNKNLGLNQKEVIARSSNMLSRQIPFQRYFREKMMSSTLVTQSDLYSDGLDKPQNSSQLVNGKYRVFAQNMSSRTGDGNTPDGFVTDLGSISGDSGLITHDVRSSTFYVPLVQRIYIDD